MPLQHAPSNKREPFKRAIPVMQSIAPFALCQEKELCSISKEDRILAARGSLRSVALSRSRPSSLRPVCRRFLVCPAVLGNDGHSLAQMHVVDARP